MFMRSTRSGDCTAAAAAVVAAQQAASQSRSTVLVIWHPPALVSDGCRAWHGGDVVTAFIQHARFRLHGGGVARTGPRHRGADDRHGDPAPSLRWRPRPAAVVAAGGLRPPRVQERAPPAVRPPGPGPGPGGPGREAGAAAATSGRAGEGAAPLAEA